MLFLQNIPSHWPQKPQKPVGQRIQGAYLGAEEAISLYVLYTLIWSKTWGRGTLLASLRL